MSDPNNPSRTDPAYTKSFQHDDNNPVTPTPPSSPTDPSTSLAYSGKSICKPGDTIPIIPPPNPIDTKPTVPPRPISRTSSDETIIPTTWTPKTQAHLPKTTKPFHHDDNRPVTPTPPTSPTDPSTSLAYSGKSICKPGDTIPIIPPPSADPPRPASRTSSTASDDPITRFATTGPQTRAFDPKESKFPHWCNEDPDEISESEYTTASGLQKRAERNIERVGGLSLGPVGAHRAEKVVKSTRFDFGFVEKGKGPPKLTAEEREKRAEKRAEESAEEKAKKVEEELTKELTKEGMGKAKAPPNSPDVFKLFGGGFGSEKKEWVDENTKLLESLKAKTSTVRDFQERVGGAKESGDEDEKATEELIGKKEDEKATDELIGKKEPFGKGGGFSLLSMELKEMKESKMKEIEMMESEIKEIRMKESKTEESETKESETTKESKTKESKTKESEATKESKTGEDKKVLDEFMGFN